jgi:hypothetical protein
MKVHILLTLALLAVGFVVPAPGQENDTVDAQCASKFLGRF